VKAERFASRVALIALVAVAAGLRAFMLAPSPDGFQPDEVVNGYDAWCLWRLGTDHHGNAWPLLFESFGDWTSPLLTYLTVPFVALGGLSAVTDRLPGVLANTGAVVAVALLTRELGGSRLAALAAAAILATSPWDIALAQFAAPPTLLPLLMAASVLFALRTIRLGRARDAAAFAVTCALLVYAYPTQKVFAPLLVTLALACFRGWRERVVAFAGFVALSLPMELISLSDPKYNARFAYVGLNPHDPQFLANVLQRYGEYLNPAFLFGPGDMTFAGVLAPFAALGLAVLVIAVIAPDRIPQIGRRQALLVLVLTALAPLPASVTVDHGHLNRMAHILPLAATAIALGVAAIVAIARLPIVRGIIVTALAAVLLGHTASFARAFYFGRHIQTGFAEQQVGLGDALVIASGRAGRGPLVVDTSELNQPYIYYLFATRYDPARLPFAQMRASQAAGITWAYVSAIGNVRFRPVTPDERSRTTPIAAIGSAAAPYELRGAGETTYLLR